LHSNRFKVGLMRRSHPVLKRLPAKSSSLPAIITLTVALLASGCGTAWAAKKPEPVYQDAILKDFHTEQQGKHCSTSGDTNGTIKADTDSDGTTNGTVTATTTSSTSCTPRMVAFYTVVMGDHTFVLSPTESGGVAAAKGVAIIATGGMGAFFLKKNSVLYGVLPGTPIKMRSEGGTVYIKVGKRESEYKIVAMK
jgi:hypothetical protein